MEETNEPQPGVYDHLRMMAIAKQINEDIPDEFRRPGRMVVSSEQAEQLKTVIGAYGQYCGDKSQEFCEGTPIAFKDLWDKLDFTVAEVFGVLGLELPKEQN